MASQLGFSDFMSDDEYKKELKENNVKKRAKNRNKTYKNHNNTKINKKKVENFLKSMDDEEDSADFNEGLANFEPPKYPEITKQPEKSKESNIDNSISPENFMELSQHAEAYNNYVPYFKNISNNHNVHGSRDELMVKLNYMIHLLEENKDEKTQTVNEELILYMFLGVFVIFVVDSFARVGKYHR